MRIRSKFHTKITYGINATSCCSIYISNLVCFIASTIVVSIEKSTSPHNHIVTPNNNITQLKNIIDKLNPNLSSNELIWLFSEILPPNHQKCKTRLKQSKQDKLFSLPWNGIGIQPRSPKYCQNWAHLTIPHQLRQLVALNSCGNKLANRSPQ